MEVRKEGNEKSLKILNIVLMVLESIFIVFAVFVTVLVFSVTDGVRRQKSQLNPTMVVLTDVSPICMSDISESDLLVNTRLGEGEYAPLNSIVTYSKQYAEGLALYTSRVVGYRYYDKGNEFYANVYYKEGVMETYDDLSKKMSLANWQFYGYIIRDDKVSLSLDTNRRDLAVYDENGNIDTSKDKDYVLRKDLLAVNNKVVKGLGSVVTIFKNTTNFILLITVPLVLFIGLNIPMMLVDIDKKEKPTKKGENS